jgi:hypothetical protein
MAGTIGGSYDLQPSSVKATLQSNYITNFDFLNQYLPDTYEQEFARYGDRSVSSFLFKKGSNGMSGSLDAAVDIFDVSPIIIKDKFEIAGSDMAQIGWVEVEGDGGMSYLWYLKSKSETRMRFEDYLWRRW